MHLHMNHVFCFAPCWGGGTYWCRYLVAIEKDSRITNNYDAGSRQDWENLTEEHLFFDEEEYKRQSKYESLKDFSDEELRKFSTKPFRKLKPEVINWLNENVKDRRDKEHPKGWCCGDDGYLYQGRYSSSISLFFERRKDALNFIKTWSGYKKPTTYFDYFRDIRKELNLETNTLQKVDNFS